MSGLISTSGLGASSTLVSLTKHTKHSHVPSAIAPHFISPPGLHVSLISTDRAGGCRCTHGDHLGRRAKGIVGRLATKRVDRVGNTSRRWEPVRPEVALLVSRGHRRITVRGEGRRWNDPPLYGGSRGSSGVPMRCASPRRSILMQILSTTEETLQVMVWSWPRRMVLLPRM